jgi:endoglucanase
MNNRNLFHLLSWLLVAMMTIGFTACSGSSDDSSDTSSYTVTSNGLTLVSKTGGTGTIVVKPSTDATVTSSATWCTITKGTTSSLGQMYNVTVAPNTETADREATITVVAGSSTQTVTVKQTAKDGLLISSDKTVNVAAAGSTVTVTLSSNGDFAGSTAYNGKISVTPSASWVTVTSTRAPMIDHTVVLTVDANTSVSRTATVSFTMNDITESLTINQTGVDYSGNITHNAKELAKLMYPGWNLGNTLEGANSTSLDGNLGVNTETSWQGTKTTKAIIDYVKAQGFKSVRIPCNWVNGHITDASTTTIDQAWIARVEEIIDYCIADGLYVVLNDHYDGGWLEVSGFSSTTDKYTAVDEATITAKIAKLKTVWTQIANHFKNYGDQLLFAGMNEPFQNYTLFNSRHKEMTPILLRYNQAFVDAVRATGGNNATRTLVVQAPGADLTSAVEDYYTMPSDTKSGYMMMEGHFYSPWDFCGATGTSGAWFWGDYTVSGSSRNASYMTAADITTLFAKLKTKFVDKGYPILLGEYGAQWRELTANQTEHDNSVKAWYKCVNAQAVNNGIITMVWDINNTSRGGTDGTMTIINRSALSVFGTPAMQGITEGTSAGTWPY